MILKILFREKLNFEFIIGKGTSNFLIFNTEKINSKCMENKMMMYFLLREDNNYVLELQNKNESKKGMGKSSMYKLWSKK